MDCSVPGLPVHHWLLESTLPMSIESVMPSNHLILCHPLLLLPSIFLSVRVFSNESALRIRWPKYWSFSFNISPSNEHPGLISCRMDWFDLFAVQGTLKSLFQHHSSKASILRCSAFFIVQLSHPYMTTGKTIALTRQTFVGKVRSVLFNMLSRLVITFLPRSSVQLLSCVQLFATPWTAAHQASLFITNSWSPPKSMSVESVIPSNHLILCHPLLNLSIFPSIRVFPNESALCIRWSKYWRFSFNISPSNEYSGVISFRMVWLDLLAVQGILKSLLQHHSSKAPFFGTQLSL